MPPVLVSWPPEPSDGGGVGAGWVGGGVPPGPPPLPVSASQVPMQTSAEVGGTSPPTPGCGRSAAPSGPSVTAASTVAAASSAGPRRSSLTAASAVAGGTARSTVAVASAPSAVPSRAS
jgi:hypothetical protein